MKLSTAKHLAFFGAIIRNLNSSFLKCFVCKTFKQLFCCGFNFDFNFSFTEIVCFCKCVWASKLLLLQPIWVWSEFVLGDYWKFSLLLIRYFKTLRHVKIILEMVHFKNIYKLIKLHWQRHTTWLIKKTLILYTKKGHILTWYFLVQSNFGFPLI